MAKKHTRWSPGLTRANVRLIDAAPALLTVLKKLVRQWDLIPDDADVPDAINTRAWQEARAAIKKARGA